MATRTDVLLVTANVGSLFDNVGEIQNEWLQELYKTIRTCQPQFIALHFQEVGGKEYMVNMGQAEEFFWNIESSDELKDFDRRCIYVDNQFQAEERFTFKWSRKGFMRTRWIIHDRGLDLVNVHLFHDASNLIACKTSPSVYSANRKNALRHVINRISDNCHNTTPFFLFGDFNFRLDTLSLVQHLSTSAEVQTVKKDSSNEVQKIICEEKADRQVILLIEDKLFAYLHQAVFRDDNGKALLKYDKEVTAFHDVVREEEITFPPSYPYSEEYTKPTQYMNTRCPAWCDRILMSHAAQQFIHSVSRHLPAFRQYPRNVIVSTRVKFGERDGVTTASSYQQVWR
ncbi:inositol polyphosphate-5-phosphatase A isoform X5 [Phyllopteryx taeniolatus]|uniref:inositol polyphosphate-5-phosphatase A isoform X5 n=1 Tax=Phyllopteryx taeniolatus TaxID=161469 RepID=UPI002AD2CE2D|nr:inositol polyphosphate-5-phosphatase A isoform X5 [Phyllopteryx taeniolatus]